MATKLTRLTKKIAIQLHLVAESCTICSSCSRRPIRKLLDTPSYVKIQNYYVHLRHTFTILQRNTIIIPFRKYMHFNLPGQLSRYSGWLRAGWWGFECRRELGIFLFTTASRPALGPTQSPIRWEAGALSLGIKRPGREADYSPPFTAEVKECVELYLHSPNTPSWRGAQLKHRNNFTFTFYSAGLRADDRGSRVRFPVGAGNFSLHHRVQNGSGAHSASYPMGTRGSFPRGKAAGALSWPLASIYCRAHWTNGAIPPLPQCAFMAWCSVKAQGQLYVFLYERELWTCFSPGHSLISTANATAVSVKSRWNSLYLAIVKHTTPIAWQFVLCGLRSYLRTSAQTAESIPEGRIVKMPGNTHTQTPGDKAFLQQTMSTQIFKKFL
jgi:hypothetical protein